VLLEAHARPHVRGDPEGQQMSQDVDIDTLSEAQLIELNHRVVARLKFLQQARSHQAILDFRIGERVSFQPDGRAPVFGMLTRYNRKSVTVITDEGQQWNVAPQLLRKVTAGRQDSASGENIELEDRG